MLWRQSYFWVNQLTEKWPAVMKSKAPLFIGILLLTTGIIIKKGFEYDLVGIVGIIGGVSLKTYYIFMKIRTGVYHSGVEFGFLILGLVLFFAGIYSQNVEAGFNPHILIIPGISLKVLFVIAFIKKG